MKSLLASVRAGGGLDRVDHAVQWLEDEWRKHGEVPLERLWAEQKGSLVPDSDEPIILLAELIRTDLRCRFARGQTPTVAAYLGRFPELNAADSRVLSLIYEEFCLKEERGDPVDVDAFCDRYPRWKESLVSQLQYHHLFSQAAGVRPKAPQFPQPGDTFEEFQLVSLLGRGGTARVFLARDLSLGGKQVVLKVSMDRGREPQAQGALDHPHIVPVNSVVFDDREMRGLSMPYRPGLPLDEVIRRVAPAARPRRAFVLWEALHRAPEGKPEDAPIAAPPQLAQVRLPAPKGDGWEGFPVGGSYAQGVAWIVKVIADALHYAHGEKTFHRDVKPANVLLTLQHGPQLLDFNLAESPHSAMQAQAAIHGGTLPYMAPEQIEAFLNPDLWGKVGAQADVYSLGLVLRELLTGQAPDLPAETLSPPRAMRVLLDRRPLLDVSVRRTNSAIPHALEVIVAKCLVVAPEHRYGDAGALSDDLARFLQRAPLVHAVNPSRREKGVNWGIRNRLRIAVVSACLVPLVAFVVGVAIGGSNIPVRPTTPIQSSPTLQGALNSLDAGDASDSIAQLEVLDEQYPQSSIPKLLLCFAHDASGQDQAAEAYFLGALRINNAIQELRNWSEDYPRLAERLDAFAKKRRTQGQMIKSRDNKGLGEGERKLRSDEQFKLTWDAVLLKLKIMKDSDPIDYDLAVALDGVGQYQAAHECASRALDLLRSRRGPDFDSMMEIARSRFKWSFLRCKVATKEADRLRAEGSESARKKALEYALGAEKDLQTCSHFVDNFTHAQRDMLWVEAIRVSSKLTLSELDLDRGRLRGVESHLTVARLALIRYKELSKQIDGTDSDHLNLLNERTEPWESRWKAANSRLNSLKRRSPQDLSTSAR